MKAAFSNSDGRLAVIWASFSDYKVIGVVFHGLLWLAAWISAKIIKGGRSLSLPEGFDQLLI